jgi:tetratricopeptide (TPR) repeat protein
MKVVFSITAIFIGVLITPRYALAQEEKPIDIEKSAAVFLEDYTDEFQENFFEALKQKGIENYDKAINLLLKCKQLDSVKTVIDYELSKAYLLNREYVLAKEYALRALESEPENIWYTQSLVEILIAMGLSAKDIVAIVPNTNYPLMENLASIFYKRKQYQQALIVLKETKKSKFTKDLTRKINDSLEKKSKVETPSENIPEIKTESTSELDAYKKRVDELMNSENMTALLAESQSAIENYPSQPYFYYTNGYALNKLAKYNQAIEVLETALDYLVNDVSLANKIYEDLAVAYNGINDPAKANKYLSKIKNP